MCVSVCLVFHIYLIFDLVGTFFGPDEENVLSYEIMLDFLGGGTVCTV